LNACCVLEVFLIEERNLQLNLWLNAFDLIGQLIGFFALFLLDAKFGEACKGNEK
jgi:hypothetical protein